MTRPMRSGSLIAGLLSICAFNTPVAVHAEDETSAASRGLDDVVVTGQRQRASRQAEAALITGNAVQIVTAQQIEEGGFVNIAEAVSALVRGANIGYSPDEGEYTIRLDGGGDRDTLVILDGVPLFDRGPALEDIWGSTTIDPHMVERIEVFRGGNSLYYGSNGGIGVVSIVTKKPDGTTKGEIGFNFGSFNTREIWANYSFPIDDAGRHSVMVFGGAHNTKGPRIFNPADFVDNVAAAGGIQDYPLNRNNIGIKYLFKIDDATEFRLNGQYTEISFSDAFPATEVFSPNTVRFPIIDASLTRKWSDQLLTELTGYYSNPKLFNTELFAEICRIRDGCIDPNNPTRPRIPFGSFTGAVEPFPFKGFGRGNQNTGGFREIGGNLRNTFSPIPWLELVGGVQVVRYQDDSDPVFPVRDDATTVTGLYVDVRPKLPFSPDTGISVAVRHDFISGQDGRTIWKFGVRQPLPLGAYVRANGGTSYSTPRNTELFTNSPTLVGNPDLKTETTKSYNFGLGIATTIAGQGFAAEIGGFITDISNRIQTTSGLTPNTFFNNTAVTEIRGITADVDFNLTSNLAANVSFTRQKATPAAGPLRGVQINETPEWFIQAGINWKSDDGRLQIQLLPRYQGPEYSTGGPSVGGVPRFRVNFGDYFVMNGSIAYLLGENKQHRVQVRVVNITNEKYAERYGFGNQFYGSAFNRGEFNNQDTRYFFGYPFEGKPLSVFLSYQVKL